MIHVKPKANITATPTWTDLVSHFFTDIPVVAPATHAWISFVRSTIFFIILDTGSYFTNLYTVGAPVTTKGIVVVLVPQIAYILIRSVQHAAVASNSPLVPLVNAAGDMGVEDIKHVLVTSGGTLPDIAKLPTPPSTPIYTSSGLTEAPPPIMSADVPHQVSEAHQIPQRAHKKHDGMNVKP